MTSQTGRFFFFVVCLFGPCFVIYIYISLKTQKPNRHSESDILALSLKSYTRFISLLGPTAPNRQLKRVFRAHHCMSQKGAQGGGNRPPESPNGPYGEPNQGPSRANEEPIRGPGGADKWAQPHACFFLTFCLPPRFFVQLDGTYFSKSKSILMCRHS